MLCANRSARHFQADFQHGYAKLLTVFRHVDGFARCADHFDPVLLEHTFPGQVQRTVQGGLPAHGRQQHIRPFVGDDLRHDAPFDRLDINRIRSLRIGHDRGRIRVHQDHPVTFLPQSLTGLRARSNQTHRPAQSQWARRR